MLPLKRCKALLPRHLHPPKGAPTIAWEQAVQGHDKWWRLLSAAHADVGVAAEGSSLLSRARALAAGRASGTLEVRASTRVGGGLGVFAKVPIREGSVITEFAGRTHLWREGDAAHPELQDYQKRLVCADIHGDAGWAAGVDKIYSCAARVRSGHLTGVLRRGWRFDPASRGARPGAVGRLCG